MEVPAELITVEAFSSLWMVFCAAWTVVWVVVAALGLRRRSANVRVGLLMVVCGPVLWGLWLLYRARIAYDPETGVAGMHRVSVLLTNLLVFVAAGFGVGLLARLATRQAAHRPPPEK